MSSFHPLLSPLAVVVMLAIAAESAANDDVEFNPHFMSPGSQSRIDLTRYNQDLAPAGRHSVELVVNDRRIGRDDITVQDRIVAGKSHPDVDICVKPSTLDALDIDVERLSAEAQRAIAAQKTPGATAAWPLTACCRTTASRSMLTNRR